MIFKFRNHAFVPLAVSINHISKIINSFLQIPTPLSTLEIHFICTMKLQDLGYYLQRKNSCII